MLVLILAATFIQSLSQPKKNSEVYQKMKWIFLSLSNQNWIGQ